MPRVTTHHLTTEESAAAEILRSHYGGYMSHGDIQKEIGVSQHTVDKFISRMGLTPTILPGSRLKRYPVTAVARALVKCVGGVDA